jgi:energy-coupling factor transporter transmembrane protein EcfT
MHPSLRILLLLLLAIVIQFMNLQSLAIVGGTLLAMALYWHIGLLRKIMYRSRWLMLTLLLVYAYTTPGEYVRAWDTVFAPTYEGLHEGVLQAGRLTMMLAALALLLGTTQRPELMAGIYFLIRPFSVIGVPVDRFTARLWLTMHYVEEEQPGQQGTFWNRFDAVSNPAEHAMIDTVRFSLPKFTFIDWMLLLTAISAVIWWLL